MLRIGIVGCGRQAAGIAGGLGVYNDEYQVVAIADPNRENARLRLSEKSVNLAADCKFFDHVDEFLSSAPQVDAVIIGTFCAFHAETACKLESLHVPVYIEKPVAINREQLNLLYQTFLHSNTPIQVSLPMRMCALVQRAKEIIDSGIMGEIHQAVGYEDTPGEVYFSTWYRDIEKTGGMFLQKAVHDVDYLFYLTGSKPEEVCAMRAKTYYKGTKPYQLTCKECPDQATCPEGPVAQFREMGKFNSVSEAIEARSLRMNPDGKIGSKKLCVFSKDIMIEDIGECIFRMESGAHVTHTQNFIARDQACRRGARLCGGKATMELDFLKGEITLFSHRNNSVERYQVDQGKLNHYGGDRELIFDFLQSIKTGKRSRTDLITGNGILSTLACICATESAAESKFVKIKFQS